MVTGRGSGGLGANATSGRADSPPARAAGASFSSDSRPSDEFGCLQPVLTGEPQSTAGKDDFMSIEVKVYDNGDHTCLVWLPSDQRPIANCRGFTVRRLLNGTESYLHGFV